MNINDTLLPGDVLGFAYFGWLLVLLQALRAAPWRTFLASSKLQHVFLGATVALFLIWIFEVGVRPALGFHFFGVTVFTLMFRWSLGVIGASLAGGAGTLMSGDWAALAMNALLLGVWPVSTSYGIYLLVYRYLPHHLFIYIFLCAFFNAMLAAGAAVLALVILLVVSDAYSFNAAFGMTFVLVSTRKLFPKQTRRLLCHPKGWLSAEMGNRQHSERSKARLLLPQADLPRVALTFPVRWFSSDFSHWVETLCHGMERETNRRLLHLFGGHHSGFTNCRFGILALLTVASRDSVSLPASFDAAPRMAAQSLSKCH